MILIDGFLWHCVRSVLRCTTNILGYNQLQCSSAKGYGLCQGLLDVLGQMTAVAALTDLAIEEDCLSFCPAPLLANVDLDRNCQESDFLPDSPSDCDHLLSFRLFRLSHSTCMCDKHKQAHVTVTIVFPPRR